MSDGRERRPRGSGSIEPTPDGRFRGRLPDKRGHGRWLDAWPTYEEAAAQLDAALLAIVSGEMVKLGDDTFIGFGLAELAAWRRRKRRNIGTLDSLFRTHLQPFFQGKRLALIRRDDVVAWRDGMLDKEARPGRGHKRPKPRPLSASVIKAALSLLRQILGAAVDRRLLKGPNPASDVDVPERVAATSDEPWTYLLPAEQRALLVGSAPYQARLIAFALGTAMREGEQWSLKISDIDRNSGRVTVRRGSQEAGTKAKKVRRFKMLPLARAAYEAQLEALDAQARAWRGKHPGEPWNPLGLLWPNQLGEHRSKGEPSWWAALVDRVGLVAARRHDGRHVRWHDLRHTSASSLVAGWYTGEPWPLERVQKWIGHGSITMTQRYAHIAESEVDRAIDGGIAAVREPRGVIASLWGYLPAENQSHLGDLNPSPTVYEREAVTNPSAGLDHRFGVTVGLHARALEALRAIAAEGFDEPRTRTLATDLIAAVLTATAAEAPAERSA